MHRYKDLLSIASSISFANSLSLPPSLSLSPSFYLPLARSLPIYLPPFNEMYLPRFLPSVTGVAFLQYFLVKKKAI